MARLFRHRVLRMLLAEGAIEETGLAADQPPAWSYEPYLDDPPVAYPGMA